MGLAWVEANQSTVRKYICPYDHPESGRHLRCGVGAGIVARFFEKTLNQEA